MFSEIPACGETRTRDAVRALYAEMVESPEGSPYLDQPDAAPPYCAGALTDAALHDALGYVNFMRRIAYVENDVVLSDLYTLRAQYAALLLAANDALAHDAPRPSGMAEDFYHTAHTGTMSSNIACINWMDDGILLTAVEYFVRDDGVENLEALGHRRWLLNPEMGATGFGLANSERGLTYAAMYAHDLTGTPGEWSEIAWPSRGAFPVELMSKEIAWSISLNPLIYDVKKSDICVIINEKAHGEAKLTHFTVNTENYGAGPCIIFVPDLAQIGIEEYQQNQMWTVTVLGLKTTDGRDAALTYEVEMVSLHPIDPASVEVDPVTLALCVGETAELSARVVPEWADDVSAAWSSSDESIATVDENGLVRAVSPGTCTITATAANGRADFCKLTVLEYDPR